ncbi:hypothetical protein [Acinetobacter sp. YH12126]|uniref:hypothetical protein n=1 Tax=Acinetobacter sp. YH12126 TaxID=2601111 RepID=UPI00211E5C70|nr:hypothetical protein [Acinetobacter sp. YH12126]
MEIKQLRLTEVISDVLCDICGQSTTLEFATLAANWGYFSQSDGERYELQLCEKCFFYTLDILKKQRVLLNSKKDPKQLVLENFGLKLD